MKVSALKTRRRDSRKTALVKRRYAALTRPITVQQVCEFSSRLVRVDYGNGECWMYLLGKSVGGASKNYARIKFNGVWVGAHRFALAVKLGCTLWALEDFDCSHLPMKCVGSKCCNPEHLFKKKPQANRSWDRAKEVAAFGLNVKTRTEREKMTMMTAMYPTGMIPDGTIFDQPWDQNVSPELRRFLEMGLKHDLQNMREYRMNTAQLTA
jgi:hypothetical protein